MNSDLSFISALRCPYRNKVVVWTLGMLVLSGLHYKKIAERIGKTAGSFRTLRTRCGIPVDRDRKKQVTCFDEEVARFTLERSGYVLRQCLQTGDNGQKSGEWFWVHKNDRSRASPMKRRRDHQIEGRSDTYTQYTRADVDREKRTSAVPFARPATMMRAG